jgi:hypothetical protein
VQGLHREVSRNTGTNPWTERACRHGRRRIGAHEQWKQPREKRNNKTNACARALVCYTAEADFIHGTESPFQLWFIHSSTPGVPHPSAALGVFIISHSIMDEWINQQVSSAHSSADLKQKIRNYNLKLENYLGYKPNFITLYLKQKIWYYNLKLEIIIF